MRGIQLVLYQMCHNHVRDIAAVVLFQVINVVSRFQMIEHSNRDLVLRLPKYTLQLCQRIEILRVFVEPVDL